MGASGLTARSDITQKMFIFTIGSIIMLGTLQCERGFVQSLVTKMTSPSTKPIVIGIFSCLVGLGRCAGAAVGSLLTEYSYAYVMIGILLTLTILVSLGYR